MIILVVLLAMPVMIIMGTAAVAAGLGWLLNHDAEARHEGSELLDVNV